MSGRPTGLGPTYRLQLTPAFGFAEAAAVADHLAALGIEYAYLSPIFEARPGSTHGYDVVDPTQVRGELGGREGFAGLAAALDEAGLKILLDIVPNHLSTWTGGAWWRDVLAKGEGSPSAPVFDIDWAAGDGKVVLPVLGRPLEEVLTAGELTVSDGPEGGALNYFETTFPLAADGPPYDAPLPDLLAAQHYRLQYWREPLRNYRRFFTIDDLVGVRVENDEVFSRTHRLIAELVADGTVAALRVDHVDGLADPAAYLDSLQALAPGCPIVIEKILTGDETLRRSWPVAGTTGYESADDITVALSDTAGLERLAKAAGEEGEAPVEEVVETAKRLVVTSSFGSEVERVARLSGRPPSSVVDATVAMPVYRTYVSPRGADERDLALLEQAGGHELRELATADPLVGDLLEGITRFQQLTSAAMAKGVEDTAWYRLVGRLPYLEVGGDPEHAPAADEDGISRLNRRARRRVARREYGLVPGTTHDTKRSADVRARLLALAEVAVAFESGLSAFAEAVPARPVGDHRPPAPGPLDRRRIAETCLAVAPFREEGAEAWDTVAERVSDALKKGAREAKSRDSWEHVNEPYEQALADAARRLLCEEGALLSRCFGKVLTRVQRFGATLSLASVVLRSTLPGVPDCYQGDEGWNFSLVDPDNRRPVDFASLRARLASLPAPAQLVPAAAGEMRTAWADGRVKLLVTRQCLVARRRLPAAFAPDADFLPLEVSGLPARAASAVTAFSRRARSGESAVVVVTRSPHKLASAPSDLPFGPSYGEAVLGPPRGSSRGRLVDVLSGTVLEPTEAVPLSVVLSALPVAVLLPEESLLGA